MHFDGFVRIRGQECDHVYVGGKELFTSQQIITLNRRVIFTC